MLSRANEDIVVREPQNPMAIRKVYLGSRFKETEKTEKTPKIKLPIILTISTFDPIIPKMEGDKVILYLKKAPAMAPKDSKKNSINPFITLPV
jgi:hypothetical protein